MRQPPLDRRRRHQIDVEDRLQSVLVGQGVESVWREPVGFRSVSVGKVHVKGDREGIQDSYGPALPALQLNLHRVFGKLFTESAPDPQLIADAAVRLVDTEKGKRPLRTPLDPLSLGVDVEYNNTTEEIKERWMGAYGI